MMQLLQTWFEVQFTHGWVLWGLGLIPLPFIWRGVHRKAAMCFGPGALASALPRTWRLRTLFIPPLLQMLGLITIVLALAGPVRWQRLPDQIEGIDILLCLDRSSSMAATDMGLEAIDSLPPATEPLDRLAVAKSAAADFLAERRSDRIGLIVFARYPDLLSPLTLHYDALLQILSQVEMVERDGPEDVTGIGTAVAHAAQLLRSSTAKSKVIILLTDGEENVATAQSAKQLGPLQAAQLCQAWGIRVYTISVGSKSIPSQAKSNTEPNPDSGSPVAADAADAADAVEQLARLTGGQFFTATNASAVQEVYGFINLLEKTELQEPQYHAVERSEPFIWFALLLMLLAQLLKRTWYEVQP